MSDVQADVDLDLYADVEGGEFGHEAGYDDTLGTGTPVTTEPPVLATGSGSSLDLFAEEPLAVPSATNDFPAEMPAIKSNGTGPSPPNSVPSVDMHSGANYAGKKVPCYVGNLQWWTTDQDLTDAIASLGITDLIEIKFYENKVNGQSKGFAVVTVGSENSFRTLMDKLPKKELHGQAPIVTYFSKHNLNQFEAQARKDMPGAAGGGDQGQQGPNPMGRGRNMPPGGVIPGLPLARPGSGPGILPRPGGLPVPPGPYQPGMIPAPGAPQVNRPMVQVPRPPVGMQGARPPPGATGMVPRSGAPGMVPNLNGQGLIRQPPPPPSGQHRMPGQVGGAPPRQDQWNQERQFQQQRPMQGMNQPFGGMGAAPGSNGLYPTPPNHHPHHGHPVHVHHPHEQGNAPGGYFSRPHERQEAMFGGGPSGGQLSEEEIKETLDKNESISRSAMLKAAADAAGGDLRSAIDTLAKAISLISKSVIGSDERSRFFIAQLQDLLKSIEDKQYQRQTSSRDRDRDRDHHRRSASRDSRERTRRSRSRDSRDRDSNRRRDKHRHRSRSRDRRDYYEDSRSYHRSRH